MQISYSSLTHDVFTVHMVKSNNNSNNTPQAEKNYVVFLLQDFSGEIFHLIICLCEVKEIQNNVLQR